MRDGVKKFLKRAILFCLAALLIAAIGLFNHICPFRTLLPAAALPPRGEGEMRVHFLSVGQGDCTVVEFPDGSLLVVDAGDGSWEHDNAIFRYLKALSPEKLSVVVTHADGDHCGGIPSLLETFEVNTLYLPVVQSTAAIYKKTLLAVNCPWKVLTRYEEVGAGGAYGVCLSPHAEGETDQNDASAVLYLEYAGVNLLLCGDISSARETVLLRDYLLLGEEFGRDCKVKLDGLSVLKVAHHGSDASSGAEWLQLLRPKTAVVSCGAGNAYGHPMEGTVERLHAVGAKIYRTDELGNIMVTISTDGTYTVAMN